MMETNSQGAASRITLERTMPAPLAEVWQLWTTKSGIESWWSPDGFAIEVRELDLRRGGALRYALTATAPQQVKFMNDHGLALTTEARKTFTEVAEPAALAYRSVVDFVPDVEPYEFATAVELHATVEGTHVVETIEPMHDDEWTRRLVMGRTNELDNLEAVLARRQAPGEPLQPAQRGTT
jgi:uncharacterized protein YndB with AHSA1/START domain